MRKMGITVVVLMFSLHYMFKVNAELNGIGFIHPIHTVDLKKIASNTIIGILIPTELDFAAIAEKLRPFNVKLAVIEQMTIFKDAELKGRVEPILDRIKTLFEYLEKALKDMSVYPDGSTTDYVPPHKCILNYAEVNNDTIDTLVAGLNAFLGKIITTTTLDAFKAADSKQLEQFIIDLFNVKDYLEGFEIDLMKRMEILTALSRGDIPDSLPFALDTLICVELGELENLHVNYCRRVKQGLFCELSLISTKSTQTYTKYLPVSYEGAQLKLPFGAKELLRASTNSWELHICEEDDYTDLFQVEDFIDCKTIPYQNSCMDNILTDKYADILKYCNFTYKQPYEAISRTEQGILFMGNDIHIKESVSKDGTTRANIPNRFPVHIITNDHLRVTVGDKEIDLIPSRTVRERSVQYTYIPDDIIVKMQTYAAQSDLKDIVTVDRVLIVVLLTAVVIISPFVICFCWIMSKHPEIIKCCTREKARDIIKNTQEAMSNYKRNKQYQSTNTSSK